jgi:hypothetical protein
MEVAVQGLPRFGADLAEAQKRIAAMLEREAARPTRRFRGNHGDASVAASEGGSGNIAPGAQAEAPQSVFTIGPYAVEGRKDFRHAVDLPFGFYKASITVMDVPPGTRLDLQLVFRLPDGATPVVEFDEELPFGGSLTKTTGFEVPTRGAGEAGVEAVGINVSGWPIKILYRFEREVGL